MEAIVYFFVAVVLFIAYNVSPKFKELVDKMSEWIIFFVSLLLLSKQTNCIMNKIILTGNIGKDISNFRKEVKELQKDWEVSYKLQYMCLNDEGVQLTITSTSNYEYKTTLLQDADTISDYLEQWTKFRTENIEIR